MLAQLRAAGHQVSLVEDIDEAHTLLASGGFEQAMLAAGSLALLLEQRALWENSDMESWRRAATGIAHDTRSLLQALDRSIQQLNEGEPPERRARADLLQAQRTISVLSSFLRELTDELDSGAGQGLSMSAIDLEDVVETAAMTVYPSALERRQRLVVDIEEEVARIQGDGPKLKRVLANLLDHASRQGASPGIVAVHACREHDDCVISISYEGDTITLTELRRLFSPASKAAESGGGGLSRVQRLVEQHSGRLWVESQKGSGTAIYVSLPFLAGAAEGGVASLTAHK